MVGHLGIIGEVEVNGVSREKCGNALYGAYGQDFVCADGKRVMVIGLTGRQWAGLLKVTGMEEAMVALGRRKGQDLRAHFLRPIGDQVHRFVAELGRELGPESRDVCGLVVYPNPGVDDLREALLGLLVYDYCPFGHSDAPFAGYGTNC